MIDRDDIIRMAREVDLHERVKDGVGYVVRIPNLEKLERFAELVAAAEREEIAQWFGDIEVMLDGKWVSYAAAIRARGESK